MHINKREALGLLVVFHYIYIYIIIIIILNGLMFENKEIKIYYVINIRFVILQ